MLKVKKNRKEFELTKEQAKYRQNIEQVKKEQTKLRDQLDALVGNCKHSLVNIHESPYCYVCDTTFSGWWCEDSPNKYCEYDPEDTWQDFCIHCGNPEERN